MDGISALMDGELDGKEARRQLAILKDDPALRERWDEFQLIGDALRGERLLSGRFNEALAARLAAEPTVLAPRRLHASPRRTLAYAMSAAASLGAVALVAWVAVSPSGVVPPQGSIAQAPVSAIKAVAADLPPLASIPNEGRMNDYLLAHQGFSPSTALQGLAPYIRSVSATRPTDGR